MFSTASSQEAWLRLCACIINQWSTGQEQKLAVVKRSRPFLGGQKSWPWSQLWTRRLWEWLPSTLVVHWSSLITTYDIAGNLRGRKLSRIGKKWPFRRENFRRLLKPINRLVWYAQISWRKLLRLAPKPRNSWMFSPLKVLRYTVYSTCQWQGKRFLRNTRRPSVDWCQSIRGLRSVYLQMQAVPSVGNSTVAPACTMLRTFDTRVHSHVWLYSSLSSQQ